nr:hypothetical protein [Tanacetum cinerariifolium]
AGFYKSGIGARFDPVRPRTFRVILFSIHNDEWKSFQSQHQTALRYSIHTVKRSSWNRRIRRWRYNLIPAESKFKTSCSIIKDKYMMKAQGAYGCILCTLFCSVQGVGFNEYCVVPPPPAQVYSPPKKDLSWMGLPEFVDDTVTDYTRPTPSIVVSTSVSKELKERWKSNNPFFFEQGGSSGDVVSKPMIKFVKEYGCPNATKVNNTKNARKQTMKYAEIPKIPIVGSKVPAAKPTVVVDKGNKGKAIKASARWIWKPKQNSSGQGLNFNGVSVTFKKYQYIDTQDFKLVDDKHVLFRTPRQQNMYTIDLKNVVPHKNLTGLIVKSLVDESMLWHRRLGHLNFKTMNNLVRNNLVKGLPSKSFENNHSYVAYLKEKQHKASCKFDAKGDKGYFVGYSLSSKAFRVFNKRNKKIEENLHVNFLENRSIEKGTGPDWLFVIDSLTNSMNYVPVVVAETFSINISAAKKDDAIPDNNAPQKEQEEVNGDKEVPKISRNLNPTASTKVSTNESFELASSLTVETKVPTVSTHVPIGSLSVPPVTSSVPKIISRGGSSYIEPLSLGNAMSFDNRLEDFFGDTSDAVSLNDVKVNLSNMETAIQYCLFSCFLSQEEPKKIVDALKDPSWVEAMQQKLLQFKIHDVWVLVDCPKGVRPIGTKWVLKNKKDEGGIVIRNKERLVAQGHTQKEGIDYEEVFTLVARIEAIRLFLAYASYMGFIVYQMDVKSAFLYETIDEEVYVMQPPGFQDPEFPHIVYKVKKAMYGLHQALRAWYGTLSKYLLDNSFQRGLQVLQKKDGIFLSQDKYVGDILNKFRYVDIRSTKTPIDRENPWGKDETDIMFAVCACARHQVTPKECHLHDVKRIFRKSTTGGCQFVGRRLISWQCKKQTIVATFTTEAEYVAAASGCGQVLWIQNQLLDYDQSGGIYPGTLPLDRVEVLDRVCLRDSISKEGSYEDHPRFEKPEPQVEFHVSLDKRLNDLMMMVLVRQTEKCDMMLHMEKSDMLMFVVEIEVGDKTADDVDKLACSADVVKSRQVDLKFVHASI